MSLVPYVHLDVDLDGCRAGTVVPLPGGDRHHLTRVLRLRSGAAVEVADGHGVYGRAVLEGVGVRLTADPVVAPAPPGRITVVQALPKGRKLDAVVRQVTELGVDRIVPVTAHRSVVALGDRADRAVARWRAVARAACEQARRPRRPVIDPVIAAMDVVPATRPSRLLVAHPDADVGLPAALEGASDVAIAVGPEGGWDDDEVAGWTEAGAATVRLGSSVLRTEHAAAAAVAVAAALLGRWW